MQRTKRAALETRAGHVATPPSPARPAGGFFHDLFSRELLRYLGPGFIVTIGFIDPGNWATNIAGGSQFGYDLLWVVSLSTLMLIFLQHLSAKLGIVTGRSLAANVRAHLPKPVAWVAGVTIVVACMATDLAEYLGAALGFFILFGLPLWLGAPLTVALVFLAILGQQYHRLERMIVVFLAIIAGCYVIELFLVSPDWATAAPHWAVPSLDRASILVALGMLGAIVMPHNIYVHSNVIQSREWDMRPETRRRLMNFELIDTTLAMGMGWLVNSAMIIVAAAVFFRHGVEVTSIEQAADTLQPLVGPVARFLFGLALLVAGLASSITSSLAEANVVTGYLGLPEDPRSAAYRIGLVATSIPAMVVIALATDPYQTLIVSQVVLSVQLPFTMLPLLWLVRSRRVMGEERTGPVQTVTGLVLAGIIIGLNVFMLYATFFGG
ncbi:MAG TPA: Nramp family divalent metal transporter [Thermoleophilia bacterium]|nr:Nramp family divalent metal transporter [Thermoleophilia bacterium]